MGDMKNKLGIIINCTPKYPTIILTKYIIAISKGRYFTANNNSL